MNTFIRNTLAALVVAAAGVTASAPAANAGGFGFEFSFGGPGGGVVIHDYGRRGGWNRFEGHRRHRDVCRPHRAIKKARHMGVRRPDVVRLNNRRVVVQGVRHHRSVRVVFANQRHCPVIRIRR
ncbi:hypothetical protein SAMN05877838_0901 [Hoeflea halophila]|uniref:Uncharacterized protein n=1 Tax=Hoeflea halophila TaxID=714899 RepID=A0A286HY72_9HYPH|nr:hypothetical protein [Hoeflea halophila]SOE12810.1 hypothetical protein SAMN05877838_0901 [Hoeflea halophila]